MLNKKDIETLCKIEHLLFSKEKELFGDIEKNEDFIIKFNDEEIVRNDINNYWNLVEKLINYYNRRLEVKREYQKERRKQNKLYGRSKKEKEKINKEEN